MKKDSSPHSPHHIQPAAKATESSSLNVVAVYCFIVAYSFFLQKYDLFVIQMLKSVFLYDVNIWVDSKIT